MKKSRTRSLILAFSTVLALGAASPLAAQESWRIPAAVGCVGCGVSAIALYSTTGGIGFLLAAFKAGSGLVVGSCVAMCYKAVF